MHMGPAHMLMVLSTSVIALPWNQSLQLFRICTHTQSMCMHSVHVSVHAHVGACRGQLTSNVFYHCLLIFWTRSLAEPGPCPFT